MSCILALKKKIITMSWHSDSWEKVVMPRNTKWSLVMIDIIWLFFNMLCEGMKFSSGFLKLLLQEQNLKFWFPCWNSPHSHGWGLELRGTVQANKFLFFSFFFWNAVTHRCSLKSRISSSIIEDISTHLCIPVLEEENANERTVLCK